MKPVVPDYDLLKQIGGGAYGEVWLARSKATGALRAAKIVWRHTFKDERPFQREFEGIQKFERIAREHPTQLALFHVGRNEAEGYFYYLMELADDLGKRSNGALEDRSDSPGAKTPHSPGPSLRDPVSYVPHTLRADLDAGRLPAQRVLEIGLALAEALGHLHSHGLVHRDVKPSNVIFVNGRPKLADIGLVTAAGDQRSIVGTEGFLPQDGPGTPQADIFALGKVLYEALTGQDRREFPDLPKGMMTWADAALAAELNEIVLKACDQRPEQRYDTEEMSADLVLLKEGKSVKERQAWRRRWATARRMVSVAALLGLLAIGGLVARRELSGPVPLTRERQAALVFYNSAKYELTSETLERLQQAYSDLTNAVRLDPGFADAYFEMLKLYWTFFGDRLPPHSNSLKNVGFVVSRLEQVAPASAQYHTAKSWLRWRERNYDEAIREVEGAVRADPKFAPAHGMYAFELVLARGETAEAHKEYESARSLDPNDIVIRYNQGLPYYAERNFDAAITNFLNGITLEGRISLPRLWLARAYEAKHQYREACDQYQQLDSTLRAANPDAVKSRYDRLRAALRDRGERALWQAIYDAASSNEVPTYDWARICARLGRNDEAIVLLNKLYTNHTLDIWLRIDECWDSLRADPRAGPQYQALLKKAGFKPW
jgi:serine/threonine protein kinase